MISPGLIEWFVTWYVFYGEELLAPRPTPKLENHPLSVVRDCLFVATIHIGGRSSIRHAVVTGTHLSWGKPYHRLFLKYENTESKCRQPFTPLSKVRLSLSWSSRKSRFLYNFTLRTVWNFMGNPRNCLVISDRWKTGRKDRHGPHTVSFFLLNTLRTGSFKLFKRPFPGFLTILTL